MQVIKHDEKDNMIFAYVIQAGEPYHTAEYDVVYNDNNKTLHIYDENDHKGTSIINNTSIKYDVLKALGEADNWTRSIVSKILNKSTESHIRFFVYIQNMVKEVTGDGQFVDVEEDSPLLYEPFYNKVKREE